MRLTEFSVRRPVTTTMIYLGVVLLGVVALSFLPLDLLPNIEPPAVSVITTYPGAGAEDVELKVTRHIEDSLGIVSNLEEIRSVSKENLSIVTCIFDWGTNLDEAANQIRECLEFVKRELPHDVETPMIFKFNTAMLPILGYGICATTSWEELRDIAEDDVGEVLKRLPGVGATYVMGGLQKQVNIVLDPKRMKGYGISIQEVASVLEAENITLPGGSLKVGTREYVLRVPGEFADLDEIRNVVIKAHGEKLVYLRDIADVEGGFKEQQETVRVDGRPGLMLVVQKRYGANTVDVMRRVESKLEEIRQTLPPDVHIVKLFDTSEFIIQSINNLSSTLMVGGVFVILVTLFFLRRARASLVIALAIPFSLISAFVFIYIFGFTINLISLAAIAIAIGMVVDNAIVVVDNITRHVDKGMDVREASTFATSEVGLAVATSTFTTVVIFLPLIFVGGITGVIFKELAIVVSVTLLASLFTALTFTPTLASRLLKKKRTVRRPEDASSLDGSPGIEPIFHRIEKGYATILDWTLRHRVPVILMALIIFAGSLMLLKFVGTEFMPEEDTGDLRVTVELPVGTRLEETLRVASEIAEVFEKEIHPEQRVRTYVRAGVGEGFRSTLGWREGPNVMEVGVKLVRKLERDMTTKEVGHELAKKIRRVPGVMKTFVDAGNPIAQMVMAGAKPVSVEVRGDDLTVTDGLAREIKKILEAIPGTSNVTISRDVAKPELVIEVDREKASSLGISMAAIADTIRSSVYGKEATEFRTADEDHSMFLRLREEFRADIQDIERLPVMAVTGSHIELGTFAEVVDSFGPIEIERKNRERVVRVECHTHGRSLGEITRDLEKALSPVIERKPQGVRLALGGMIKEQKRAFRDIYMLLGLGILLVYMVMASQFESFRHPFVIMFSVPFALVGAILGLFLTGFTLSVSSFIGVIMLVGIVVNNAIVLVDYTNVLRMRGMSVEDAVRQAGRTRLRPVLMTSLTTIFGLFPMTVSGGEGSEIWAPIGTVVCSGLFVSMLVTLVLVPTVYSVVERRIRTQ